MPKNNTPPKVNWLWICRLVILIGLATSFTALLVFIAQGVLTAHATASIYYVDHASGQDTGSCGSTASPCKSVTYAVENVVNDGDTVRIAQGKYTENLSISTNLTLEGGYEASTWNRDLTLYETTLDGSGPQIIPGDWDGSGVQKASVLNDGGTYKMWFDGVDLYEAHQVGYATSSNETTWIKYTQNPILTGTEGSWDERGEHAPFIVKDGSVYKMWYEGRDGSVRQLGYATSSNGVDWMKYSGNPVLKAGPEGYDQEVAGHGSILKDGSTYKLWYHAIGDQGVIIAYATSPDGINWTKGGPVLLPSESGWDDMGLWGPSVIKIDSTYWMWYSSHSSLVSPAIGLATSTNGMDWTRVGTTPVITETGPIGDPHVIYENMTFKMWYTDFEQGTINYAESGDGIIWTKSASNPVLSPGTPGEWGEPVINIEDLTGEVILDGLTITGGKGQCAGGVCAGDTEVTIRDCMIKDNVSSGGGGVNGGKPLNILDSYIVDNQILSALGPGSTGGAGGVLAGSPLFITNSLIADNLGDAGIHVNGDLTMMNVTIGGNDGDVIFNPQPSGTLNITNSILYDNNDSHLRECPDGSTCNVNYSDLEMGWSGGTGNINIDPEYFNPNKGNYRLKFGSPAVDKGTNSVAPDHDLDDNPRPFDGDGNGSAIVDMGAYELVISKIYLPIIMKNQ